MRLALSSHHDTNREAFWHIQAVIIFAIGLELLVNNDLVVGSKYAVAGLEACLLVLISLPWLRLAGKRLLSMLLLCLITLANITSLGLVIGQLVGGPQIGGQQLLLSSAAIYLTNIIVFGLLYWELDGTQEQTPDFEFPQSESPAHRGWKPTFFDYLYVSITNASAFSPTDTMPLTHRAKLLMTTQSLASLLTVVLVAARAVNILS